MSSRQVVTKSNDSQIPSSTEIVLLNNRIEISLQKIRTPMLTISRCIVTTLHLSFLIIIICQLGFDDGCA